MASTSANATVIMSKNDLSSAYYIHPSDATTSQLVSSKFNGNRFTNWKRSMMLTLSARNKLGFVNGTITKSDNNSPDLISWERCNDLVISWILHNLDENIAKSVLFLNTARDIWKDLEDRVGFASVTQVYTLEQKLTDITQGTQSIFEFFTQIKSIWDSIDDVNPLIYYTCGKCICEVNSKHLKKQQEQRLLQFLMKINDQFSAVRGHILMMHPLPTVSQAFRLLMQEENYKEFLTKDRLIQWHFMQLREMLETLGISGLINLLQDKDLVLIKEIMLKSLTSLVLTIFALIAKFQGIAMKGASNYMDILLDLRCFLIRKLQLFQLTLIARTVIILKLKRM